MADLATGLAKPDQPQAPLPAPPPDLVASPQPEPSANRQSARDPVGAVMQKIYGGESGGNPYALYGGGNFGFPSWSGRMGPAGISHAAGLGQDEPQTWHDAVTGWMAANPGQPAPDFRNPQDQDKVNRFLARKTYGTDENGRNLDQAAAAGAVDYSRLAKVWPSLEHGNAAFPNSAQAERVRAAKYAEASDLDASAKAAIAQIGAMGGDLSKAMERVRAAQDKANQAQEATAAALQKQPALPQLNALQHLGGLATVVGVLGGLFTHAPMRASINAAAAAIEGYNQSDLRAYQLASDSFKTNMDMLFKISDMQQKQVSDILLQENLGFNERRTLLDTTLRAAGLSQLADVARTQGESAILDWQEKMASAQQAYRLHMDTLNQAAVFRDAQIKLGQERNDIARTRAGAGSNALDQYGEPPDKPSDNPNLPTEGSNIPRAVWDGATQLALTGHMPVLGNSAAGRAAIQSALPWVLAARGMTAADMTEQGIAYGGALAGERTLSTRLANLTVGLSEVPHLGEQLVQVSDATSRTDLMDVNKLLQAYQTRTGDPQIIRLGAALNSYLQAYARAINPTGVISDDMRAHADQVLNQAMSRGQIQAGVDQLNQELIAMRQGLSDAAATGKQMFPLPGEKRPQGVPPALFSEFSSGNTGGKAKYSVGQIIDTPKGKYRVTGGDLDGDPDVEPVH